MKKIYLVITASLFSLILLAQRESSTMFFLKDSNGGNINTQPAVIDETSYLFNYEHLTASLFGYNGKILGVQPCRLHLKTNRIFYLSSNGDEMEITTPVKRIEFNLKEGKKAIFERDFTNAGVFAQGKFYQVLAEGKAWLIMDTEFAESTRAQYGSASVDGFSIVNQFYCFKEKTSLVKINNENTLLNVLKDKSELVKNYISADKIKIRKKADLERLFNYYNTL